MFTIIDFIKKWFPSIYWTIYFQGEEAGKKKAKALKQKHYSSPYAYTNRDTNEYHSNFLH